MQSLNAVSLRLPISAVSSHRRSAYRCGEIPHSHAVEFGSGDIELVHNAACVIGKNIALAKFAWTPNHCCYLIDYKHCHSIDPWHTLDTLISHDSRAQFTLMCTNHTKAKIRRFCSSTKKDARIARIIPETQTTARDDVIVDVIEYDVSGTIYKTALHAILRRGWCESDGPQKAGQFNAPHDISNSALTEMTQETMKRRGLSNAPIWSRRSYANAQLWDLTICAYAIARYELKN